LTRGLTALAREAAAGADDPDRAFWMTYQDELRRRLGEECLASWLATKLIGASGLDIGCFTPEEWWHIVITGPALKDPGPGRRLDRNVWFTGTLNDEGMDALIGAILTIKASTS
jgi:hypothetical protein